MRLAPLVLVVLLAACGEPRPPAAITPDGGPDAGSCVVNDVPALCARAGVTCGPAEVDCNGVQLGVDCGPCDGGPDSGPVDAGVDAGSVGDGGPPDGGCFATADCGFNQHCEAGACVETPGSCSTPDRPGHCPAGSTNRPLGMYVCDDCGSLPMTQCHVGGNPGHCDSGNTCTCTKWVCLENCRYQAEPTACAAGLVCTQVDVCEPAHAEDVLACLLP